jgi:murein DD-endopeptidase MepM/ murein hydrolase activator NlpD
MTHPPRPRRPRRLLIAAVAGAVIITTGTIAAIRPRLKPEPVAGPTIDVGRTASSADVSAEPAATATPEPQTLETRTAYASGTIETNLFDDGQEAGLSDALIIKLTEIFGWDVDFALGVRKGDRFTVIFEERYWLGQKVGDGQILAAEFVNRGHTLRAIGRRNDKGYTHYYTPEGMEMQRMFLRTPVKYTRISSRYTETAGRLHPILKRMTAHRGVDYAAPTGTPVRATAVGRVLALGPDGGYGNRVIVNHGGKFETVYGHLSKFEPGVREGSLVEQGQIIGYVGSTGLSTGPHLHYEFRVDGTHRDPLNYRFPAAARMATEIRGDFLKDVPTWSAKLDTMNGVTVAIQANPDDKKN